MDETPYPPPVPGAPQPPAPPAPPADYASTAPPAPAGYGVPAAAPPKKNKTLVIVLVIVGVLLVCCIGGVVATVLWVLPARQEITQVEDSSTVDEDGTPADGQSGAADPAWDEFTPPPFDSTVYVEPSDRNAALAEEIVGTLYPDFVIDEITSEPGEFDGETYWMDNIYIAASLADDPDVRIVFPLYIQLEEGQAEGLSTTDPESLDSNEVLATTADGTEYIYYGDMFPGLLNGISDPDAIDLLAQVQADFPDALAEYVEVDGEDGYLSVTKWNAYPPYSGGFSLTYTRAGDGWEYTLSEPWSE